MNAIFSNIEGVYSLLLALIKFLGVILNQWVARVSLIVNLF